MNNPFTLKLLITGTLISIIIMAYTGHPLKQSSSDYKSILALEFANTSFKVEAILKAWQSETIRGKPILHYARINTYWDFMFIFFYSTTIFFAHQSLSRANLETNRLIRSRGDAPDGSGDQRNKLIFKLAANAALIAGILDIIENIGMLKSMKLFITEQNSLMTAICAKLKFSLVVLSIIVLLSRWISSKFKTKNE